MLITNNDCPITIDYYKQLSQSFNSIACSVFATETKVIKFVTTTPRFLLAVPDRKTLIDDHLLYRVTKTHSTVRWPPSCLLPLYLHFSASRCRSNTDWLELSGRRSKDHLDWFSENKLRGTCCTPALSGSSMSLPAARYSMPHGQRDHYCFFGLYLLRISLSTSLPPLSDPSLSCRWQWLVQWNICRLLLHEHPMNEGDERE